MQLTKTDLSLVIKNLDGDEMFTPGKTDVPVKLTVRLALRRALTSQYQDEMPPPDGDEKFLRFVLARRIYESDDIVEVKKEEEDVLKKCIAKAWGPEVVGFLYELLGIKEKKQPANANKKK